MELPGAVVLCARQGFEEDFNNTHTRPRGLCCGEVHPGLLNTHRKGNARVPGDIPQKRRERRKRAWDDKAKEKKNRAVQS